MDTLDRILSAPAAKPYRGKHLKDQNFYVNDQGQVDFHPDNDIENPKCWSTKRRWLITVISVLLTVNATFASSAPSGCLMSISTEFGVSREAAGLVITVFLLGYVAGPLLWAPMSEFYGRRYVCLGSFAAYIAFNFLCAFTPNFGGLLVGRFLTGTLASAGLSNVPGVLADIWGPIERGNAMALFSMMTFIGPALGPVVGGFLQLKKDWRWIFYVLLWLAGGTAVAIITVPETHPATVLLNKAKRIRKLKIEGYENVKAPVEETDRTLVGLYKVALTRPWVILFDPISLLVAIYLSVVYTLLYMLFSIYPIVFQEMRGWNAGVSELPLIGTSIGACLGGAIVFYDSHINKKRANAGREGSPEDRLRLGIIAGVLFPISMFWFAWTANFNSIHWFVPTLAGVFLSTSIMLVFVTYLTYLTDSYLQFAASAIAANTVARSACGAAAPLFTNYMFKALGIGGGGSLIGGVACLLAPIPFIFYKYGAKIRAKSKFAPTDDTKEEKGKDENENQDKTNEKSRSRQHSTDEEEKEELKELDEQAGVPLPADLAKARQKEQRKGDPYSDADGMEKAE